MLSKEKSRKGMPRRRNRVKLERFRKPRTLNGRTDLLALPLPLPLPIAEAFFITDAVIVNDSKCQGASWLSKW